jgi:hypothetical protein
LSKSRPSAAIIGAGHVVRWCRGRVHASRQGKPGARLAIWRCSPTCCPLPAGCARRAAFPEVLCSCAVWRACRGAQVTAELVVGERNMLTTATEQPTVCMCSTAAISGTN